MGGRIGGRRLGMHEDPFDATEGRPNVTQPPDELSCHPCVLQVPSHLKDPLCTRAVSKQNYHIPLHLRCGRLLPARASFHPSLAEPSVLCSNSASWKTSSKGACQESCGLYQFKHAFDSSDYRCRSQGS